MAEIMDPREQYKDWKAPKEVKPNAFISIEGLKGAENKINVGDPVSVVRSDGTYENDWKLKSFGASVAVAEKLQPDGQMIQKVVPLQTFKQWQYLRQQKEWQQQIPKEQQQWARRVGDMPPTGLSEEETRRISGV